MIPTSTSNSQNYNRFSYVLNNPLKYVDPSGYVALNPWYETMINGMRFFKEYPEMGETFEDINDNLWKLKKDMKFSDENGNVFLRMIGDGLYVEIAKYQEYQEKLQQYNSQFENADFGFIAGAGVFRVEGEESHNLQLRYEIIPSSTSEFDGFGGKLKYCFNGGNINGWKYDISGKFEGAAPIGGIAPVPSFSGLKIKNIWNLAKALKATVRKGQAPKDVLRIDIPTFDRVGNPLHGQKPHVHLKDNRAFNLDGTWKHGDGDISNSIIEWLYKYIY